jgi:hypothetical protein
MKGLVTILPEIMKNLKEIILLNLKFSLKELKI